MRVWRTFVNHLVQIEEPGRGNPRFAKGVEALSAVVRKKPCCAESDGPGGGGDFCWRVCGEGFFEFGGGDEVGTELACGSHFEDW